MKQLNNYIIEKLHINKKVQTSKNTFEPCNETRDFVKKILVDDLGVLENDIIIINVMPSQIYVEFKKNQYEESEVGWICENVVETIKEKYKIEIFGSYSVDVFQIDIKDK